MCSLGDVVINVQELPDYVARGVVDGVEERWPKKMAALEEDLEIAARAIDRFGRQPIFLCGIAVP